MVELVLLYTRVRERERERERESEGGAAIYDYNNWYMTLM